MCDPQSLLCFSLKSICLDIMCYNVNTVLDIMCYNVNTVLDIMCYNVNTVLDIMCYNANTVLDIMCYNVDTVLDIMCYNVDTVLEITVYNVDDYGLQCDRIGYKLGKFLCSPCMFCHPTICLVLSLADTDRTYQS